MGDRLRTFMTKVLADALVPIFTGLLRSENHSMRHLRLRASGLIATYGFAVVTLPLWILILSRFV
jgi:hypothetical protein